MNTRATPNLKFNDRAPGHVLRPELRYTSGESEFGRLLAARDDGVGAIIIAKSAEQLREQVAATFVRSHVTQAGTGLRWGIERKNEIQKPQARL